MRKKFILIFTLSTLLVLFGCSNSNNVSILNDQTDAKKELLKYDIEQISFSKSFQSIDPSVEIVANNKNNLKLLAHLGLSDYSTVKVNKILMEKSNIDIYVSGDKDDKKTSLSVPKMVINLNKDKINDLENIKLNILYDDFTPIKIKFNINDVLNKLESHFKISTKSSPRFDLITKDDNIYWEITYSSIFYKSLRDTPLINLYALVDANSGEIIESDKNIISSVLDNGHILDYIRNQALIYKQIYKDGENTKSKEQLYTYNIKTEKKDLLYTSNYKISSGEISPNLKKISFIESSENGNEVYITSNKKSKVYKVPFDDNFNPQVIKWKGNNILYILGNENNNSTIYTYNLADDKSTLIKKLNKEFEDFSIFNDQFLLIEKSNNRYNKNILLTKDFKELQRLNNGFSPKFIDDENIAYLNKDEDSNINHILLYNLKNEKIISTIDSDVVSFSVYNNSIIYIKNNPNYNDFTLYNYSIDNKVKSYISYIMCKNVYYNTDNNILYLNTILPFEDNDIERIYLIDLNNIKDLNNAKNP